MAFALYATAQTTLHTASVTLQNWRNSGVCNTPLRRYKSLINRYLCICDAHRNKKTLRGNAKPQKNL